MNRFLSKMDQYNPQYLAYGQLLLVYFLLRLFFKTFLVSKQLFIAPTGLFTSALLGSGFYVKGEWVYELSSVRFVLGESCSGTTFFSLLVAFLVFKYRLGEASRFWLILAFPLVILANTLRVSSSIIAYQFLTKVNLTQWNEPVHIACGVISFLGTLLFVAYFISIINKRPKHELAVETL